MAKGFDMKGERRKKQDNEQKAGNDENIGIAYGQKRTEDKRERERQKDVAAAGAVSLLLLVVLCRCCN